MEEAQGKSEAASSRDLSSVQQAGPCMNWRALQHMSAVVGHMSGAKTCETLEALKAWSGGCDETFKQLHILVTSCWSAVSDMLSAHSHAESEAKKQEENIRKVTRELSQYFL